MATTKLCPVTGLSHTPPPKNIGLPLTKDPFTAVIHGLDPLAKVDPFIGKHTPLLISAEPS